MSFITWQRIPKTTEMEKTLQYNLSVWDIHFHCTYSRKFSTNELVKSDVKIYIIRFQSQQADKII